MVQIVSITDATIAADLAASVTAHGAAKDDASNIAFKAHATGISSPLVARYSDCLHLKYDFGVSSGDDASQGWDLLAAELNSTKRRIIVPSGDFSLSRTISLLDGVNGQAASIAGITLDVEGPAGIGAGFTSGGLYGARFTWTGATDSDAVMFEVNGPAADVQMNGGLYLDCAGKAGRGFDLWHLYRSRAILHTERFTTLGGNCKARDYDWSGIVTYGFARCDLILDASQPNSTACHGINFEGGPVNNVAFSRNRVESEVEWGGGAHTYGYRFRFADNNWDLNLFANRFLAAGGAAIRWVVDSGWCKENRVTTALIGPVEHVSSADETVADTGGGMNYYFLTADDTGANMPDDARCKVVTNTGKLIGGWVGSTYDLFGSTAPGTGIGTSTEYLPIAGVMAAPQSVASAYVYVDGDKRLYSLAVVLDTAPGTGATRTFTVLKNGSATALTVTFGATDSGRKRITVAVDAADLDHLQIASTVTGTPATANAHWTLTMMDKAAV